MSPKVDSTKKKTPKKKDRPSTLYLWDEATNNKSSGYIKNYPLEGAIELRKFLPQGLKLPTGGLTSNP